MYLRILLKAVSQAKSISTEAPWGADGVLDLCRRKNGVYSHIASEEGLFVQCSKRPQAIPHLRTGPYPEFPTESAVGGNGGADESGRMQLH